jgi:hypothetical protein
MAAVKLSIITTLLHVFPQHTPLRYILYGTSAVVICLFLSSIPLTLFQCTPLQAVLSPQGNVQTGQSQCINFISFMYVSTIIHVTTDLVLVVVPLPYLGKLNVSTANKFALAALFSLGAL